MPRTTQRRPRRTRQSQSSQKIRSDSEESEDARVGSPEDTSVNQEHVKDLLLYWIAAQANKGGCKDLDVKKAMGLDKNSYIEVSQEATTKLQEVLSIQRCSDGGVTTLHTLIDLHGELQPVSNELVEARWGLLFTVLTWILMKGNAVGQTAQLSKKQMFAYLEELGLTIEGTDSCFGDIEHLFSAKGSFVKTGYLAITTKEGEEKSYSWGPAALAAVNPLDCVEEFLQICSIDDPTPYENNIKYADKIRTIQDPVVLRISGKIHRVSTKKRIL